MEKYYRVSLKYVNPNIKKLFNDFGEGEYKKSVLNEEAFEKKNKSIIEVYGNEERYNCIKQMQWLNFICGESKKQDVQLEGYNDWNQKITYNAPTTIWDWVIALDTICTINGDTATDIWTGKKYKAVPCQNNNSDILVLRDTITGRIHRFEKQNSENTYKEKQEFVLTYDEENPLSTDFVLKCIRSINNVDYFHQEKVFEAYDKQFSLFKSLCEQRYDEYNAAHALISSSNNDDENSQKIKEYLSQHCLANKNQH